MRLIDADALIDGYKHMGYDPSEHPEESYMEGWCKGFNSAVDHCVHHAIHAPTIEPERKTGHWIPQDHNHTHGNVSTCIYFSPVCSECGHAGDFNMNYCPNCGADMRGKQDDEQASTNND